MGLFSSNIEKFARDSSVDIRTVAINPKKTVVVNIDTINGFFKEGALASPRLVAVIPKIVNVNEYFLNSKKIFFVDKHTSESIELKDYPMHCISEIEQSIIKELEVFAKSSLTTIIYKNSTNPFLSSKFLIWLKENSDSIDSFIITGGVTDICVMQFALTLKAYLNENDIKKRVAVVENAVQTFDNESHDGNKLHSFAIYNMMLNGISIYTI